MRKNRREDIPRPVPPLPGIVTRNLEVPLSGDAKACDALIAEARQRWNLSPGDAGLREIYLMAYAGDEKAVGVARTCPESADGCGPLEPDALVHAFLELRLGVPDPLYQPEQPNQ